IGTGVTAPATRAARNVSEIQMKESLGFIGGGRIVRILLHGWKEGGNLPENIVISDPDREALDRITKEFPGVHAVQDNNALAAGQDLVFLAIHPKDAEKVLPAFAPALNQKAVVISFMPNLTIDRISGMLGGFDRIVRAIPSAPSIVGSGYTPVAFSPALRKWDAESLELLLESISHLIDVPEQDLEAYAIISAMGPTYLWFQLYELERIAESFGLPPERASDAVRKMAEGTVMTMRWSNLTPEQVMDLVPARPLGEDEETIKEIYRKRLQAFLRKLKS
ncbi:MAG: NAD(P)-binding domain-containing protein, partial [Methanolinea sp.]|nr:NAD(P)-binding domain-containing protein [Methanolinea sp.]